MIEKICENCKCSFKVHNYRGDTVRFCSRKCRGEFNKINYCSETFCENCGKILFRSLSRIKEHNYCSTKCKNEDPNYLKRLSHSIKNSENPVWGRYWQHINKGKHFSPATEYKPGKDHPMWKGGNSKKRGLNWDKEREEALKRDDYTCQRCDTKEDLCVHHIEKYKETQDNSLDNLVTLCRRCHIIREKGYSKMIVDGEDICIKHVPPKTYESFMKLSKEFNNNSNMVIKHLVDFYDGLIPSGIEHVEEEIMALNKRIDELELASKKESEQKKTTTRMDGTVVEEVK